DIEHTNEVNFTYENIINRQYTLTKEYLGEEISEEIGDRLIELSKKFKEILEKATEDKETLERFTNTIQKHLNRLYYFGLGNIELDLEQIIKEKTLYETALNNIYKKTQ